MVEGQPFTIYDDRESYTIPVTFFYKVRPKVDLTAGVRYRNTETEGDIEYTDLYYYVGAVGELFSPVIYADLTVGYQERDAKGNLADTDSASYKFSLIYTGDPKGTAYFTLARDYRTSAVNSSTYAFTSAAIGGNYAVTDTIGVNAAIVYGESVYEESNREDDIRMVRLGASYQPNDYFTVDASYYRRDVDGNTADYVNNEFRVTASKIILVFWRRSIYVDLFLFAGFAFLNHEDFPKGPISSPYICCFIPFDWIKRGCPGYPGWGLRRGCTSFRFVRHFATGLPPGSLVCG
jgi:hypothetical protein